LPDQPKNRNGGHRAAVCFLQCGDSYAQSQAMAIIGRQQHAKGIDQREIIGGLQPYVMTEPDIEALET
jgi:hypothetical protein